MKPENHHKIKSNARADSRVKMHLRNQLAWLWGFPQQPHSWCSIYFPGSWGVDKPSIDGSLLSSTRYNHNKLIRDYPKALPRHVGDVGKWSNHIDLKLQLVQSLLKGENVDPWSELIAPIASVRLVKYAQSLKRSFPALSDEIDRFAWWLSGDLEALAASLTWFERESVVLTSILKQQHIIEYLIPKLFYLNQRVGSKRCHSLLIILQSSAWKNAFIGYFHADLTLSGRIFIIENDGQLNRRQFDLTLAINDWLDQILPLPKRELSRYFDALSILFPEAVIDLLEQRWQLIGEIPSILSQQEKLEEGGWSHMLSPDEEFKSYLDSHIAAIQAIEVPYFNASQFKLMLLWYGSDKRNLSGLTGLLNVLEPNRLPATSVWKTPMLTLFIGFHHYYLFRHRDGAQWFRSQASIVRFIEADGNVEKRLQRIKFLETWLDPKHVQNSREYGFMVFNHLPVIWPDLAEYSDVLDRALSNEMVEAFTNNYDEFLAEKKLPIHTFAVYIKSLLDNNISIEHIYDNDWERLHAIAHSDSQVLLACLPLWGELTENGDVSEWEGKGEEILSAAAYLHRLGLGEVADYFATKQDLSLVKQCGMLASTFDEIKLELVQPAIDQNEHQDWIAHYPEALHVALKQLCKYHMQAEKVAEKHLSRYCVSPVKINTEIQALQQKIKSNIASGLSSDNLEKRLYNLQRRLQHPTPLSPALIEKLDGKLIHSAYSSALNQWHSELKQSLLKHLSDNFQLHNLPEDSLGHSRHTHALMALLNLGAKTQTIAQKILFARLGESPWDLRDEPANQRFLQRMQRLGVHTEPWVNGIGRVLYVSSEGDDAPLTLSVQLEDDPLEILHMGSHFQTCLSAFSFNYFSVVANIADINKRVIYIRDDREKIVGRCLFALNDSGHLLNFHHYSHLASEQVSEAVECFANKLATEMKTIRADNGNVSTCVADSWYDDGTVSCPATSPVFVKDKAFRKQLLVMTLEQAQQHFQRLLQQETLKQVAILHLLRLPEFKQRPELSLALWDEVRLLPMNDRDINLKMAQHLVASGHKQLALRLVRNWRLQYKYFNKRRSYYEAIPKHEIELLISISPSLAYRALLRTRHRNIKTDDQDYDDRRLFYLAQIHELLYRPRKAVICYQAALGRKRLSKDQVALVKAKINELSTEN